MNPITKDDSLSSTQDIVKSNIEQLKNIFPEVFAEDRIDFEALQSVLGDYIESEDERYSFTWKGKANARRIAQTPSTGTLRPAKEESKNWDTTGNLYIEGDNLEVLKLLQKSYHSKVKMIYIDPPYNTGKDFVYSDDFKDNLKNYLEQTGQVNQEGKKVSTNSDTNGRYHSNWLNMMYPRLKLARNLLSDDGVIFISIDDNEVHNLRKICDEIFGEENFIVTISRVTGTPTGGGFESFVKEVDYVLVYTKTQKYTIVGLPLTENEKKIYDKVDDRGRYLIRSLRRTGGEDRREDRPSMYYPIKSPSGTEVYPIGPTGYDSRWICGEERYHELQTLGQIEWVKDKQGYKPFQKFYLEGRLKQPSNLWKISEGNKKATRDIRDLFDSEKVFDFPKPTGLIKDFIQILNLTDSQDNIILDFFSGSATTAHAVMQLNAEDGENRKFIMVQLPEPIEETHDAYKAGYRNISEIGKERIRRAGDKIVKDLEGKHSSMGLLNDENQQHIKDLDIGFKVFKLDSSNIKTWDSAVEAEDLQQALLDSVSNIKPERTQEDVLYEVLLKYGLDLTLPIEEYEQNGKKLYSVGFGSLVICIEDDIDISLAEKIVEIKDTKKPEIMNVIFKDNGFKDDVVKTNTIQLLSRHGVESVRSI